MTTVGIDPGLTGAIAVINSKGSITLHDCPTLSIGKKTVYYPLGMVTLLKNCQQEDNQVYVAIEKVHSMPGQGVSSTFMFGEGFGLWLGILAALDIPHELITPQAWKKGMMDGQTKDKDASRLVAVRLFPSAAEQMKLKKHHGRADALLLAEFARRKRIKE